MTFIRAPGVLAPVLAVAVVSCPGPVDQDDDDSGEGPASTTSSSGGNTGITSSSSTSSSTGGPSECAAFTEGLDLKVCAATYLSGSTDDGPGGMALAPNGNVVYGGALPAGDFGAMSSSLLAGGPAGIAILSADAQRVLTVIHMGSSVQDVDVGSDGTISVVGDFGLAVLNGDNSLRFSKTLRGGTGTRVSVGQDGSVAAAAGTKVDLFSSSGDALGQVDISQNREQPDIVLDSAHSQVIATGYNQRDGGGCSQLQVPFIRAYGYDGQLKWKNYDWTHAEVAAVQECADSRGYGLGIGADGKLYYAGESHGGNSVHRRMPRDLSQMAPNVKPDKYQDGYNMNGAAPMGYVARFDLASGDLEVGSVFVTRLSSGKGNAVRPRAVAANGDGHVLVTGATACCIDQGDQRTLNGTPAMPTYTGGGFVLVLSPSFTQRLTWTTFNGPTGGGANGVAAAARNGAMAVLMNQSFTDKMTTEAPLYTVHAVQAAPGGGKADNFLALWRGP